MDARTDESNLAGARARAKPRAPDALTLLAWYDLNQRTLPWRAAPGVQPDPFRVWLSEIMLQQTRVETVAPYFLKFMARWPDVRALAAAKLSEVLSAWAGLGYYARARNLHACAREIARRGCEFPRTEAELRELPGVGAYTAAAIAAIAFEAQTIAIDGNVERVVARLFALREPLPKAKAKLHNLANSLLSDERHGDFVQALMELGATVCTPRNPNCHHCPLMGACEARALGKPEQFPRKTAKKAGKLRRGAAFIMLREDGTVLLRTRPAKGLLGGMTEVPTSLWVHRFDDALALGQAPLQRVWQRLPGTVRHVFTHFPLELAVFLAHANKKTRPPKGMRFVREKDLDREALPTLMRKVLAHASKTIHPKGRAT